MRPRVAYQRDTLNTRRLPRDEPTFLDYRTSINTEWFDGITTLRLIFVSSVLLVPLAVIGRLVAIVGTGFPLLIGGLGLALIIAGLFKSAFLGRVAVQVAWGGMLLLVAVVALFMENLANPRTAFLALAMPALLLAAWVAFLAGKQVSFWMTANHQIDQQTMFRWRRLWSFSGDPEDHQLCPELLTIPIVLAAVPVGCLAGFAVLHFFASAVTHPVVGLAALATTFLVIALAWVGAHQFVANRFPPPGALLSAAWRTLRIFTCYNRHDTPAAGVFRFPSGIVRSVVARDFFLGTTLALLSLALVALLLPAPPPFSWKALWPASEQRSIQFNENELDRYRSLPFEQAQDFLNRLTAEKQATILEELNRSNRQGQREGLWPSLVVTLLAGVLGPPVTLLLLIAMIGGSTVHRYYESLDKPDAPLQSQLTPWQTLVDRLINSPNAIESNHFFLGTSLYHDYPILLDENILTDHGHILGDTGAYKTSMGIAPIATQLIAKGRSVLMIDLKGEPPLFHGLREEAARAGVPFKWFTTTPNRSSYVFNPFLQKNWRKFTSNQRVQIVLSALSLDYGFDYGRAYFTAMNETVLASLVRKQRIESFEDIYVLLNDRDMFKEMGNLLDWEKARHLLALVNRLRTVFPLNLTPTTLPDRPDVFEHAIELSDLLYEPQVIYFYLKAPIEPLSTAGVAKLAIYSLFTAAAEIEPDDGHRAYVLIDEFQQIISNSVERVLEQGRSLGTSFILSHQTKGQTKRGGIDIQETVESCTAFKQNYRASDLKTIMELEQLSGQGMFHRFAWSQAAPSSDDDEEDVGPAFSTMGDVTVTESTGTLMDRNLIMELSADPQGSIVRFTKDSGYTRFGGKATPILSDFHITRREFHTRKKSTFPDAGVDTVVVEPDLGDTIDVAPIDPSAPHSPAMARRMPLLPDGSDPDEKLGPLQ